MAVQKDNFIVPRWISFWAFKSNLVYMDRPS
ncbi:uncharacterized protein LOC110230086 [Arabidopsis lyrata subsp. lyrata]|nr:uncharacterized protein LOC110230086 [Arabidopsis lyrata subsp. lyrata]|eukprot:XP_020887733.1 uncharacterized protein LOC110230086 [Arabidopsis lyrata subsp. lyrata]